ncbi:hypothetical protein HDU96_000912 [Phlyctochytrium bullatum]|nr:hypothetical protein HDU96_000912 [Phlyctochytrium bullatum]
MGSLHRYNPPQPLPQHHVVLPSPTPNTNPDPQFTFLNEQLSGLLHGFPTTSSSPTTAGVPDQQHQLLSLVQKPFRCPNCPASFSRSDSLKKHLEHEAKRGGGSVSPPASGAVRRSPGGAAFETGFHPYAGVGGGARFFGDASPTMSPPPSGGPASPATLVGYLPQAPASYVPPAAWGAPPPPQAPVQGYGETFAQVAASTLAEMEAQRGHGGASGGGPAA